MDEKLFEKSCEMLSEQELTNMTAALKNPEFRKLLAEYCNEMADPVRMAQYEKELTQFEAERGVELIFITPTPGFVIKTTVDGRMKGFINVCRSEKVDRPTSHYAVDASGRRGLQWSIPMTQAPPRPDYDNKKEKCTVYDVVFHPDTLHLAARNREFRQLVINTACDAVESAFQVTLDRVNIRLPKLTFKGTAHPTVIRKRLDKAAVANRGSQTPVSRSSSSDSEGLAEKSFADQFYPPVDMSALNGDRPPTVVTSKPQEDGAAYTIPKYKLVYRRGVDLHEMTHERDAKLNSTLPKELVVTVDLPLLKSSKPVKLDVREQELELICEDPVKYRLHLQLPYVVHEDRGSAQFDSGKRQLVVTLPVHRRVELKLDDLTRALQRQPSGDSGVDSPSSHSHSSSSSDEENTQMPDAAGQEEVDGFLEPNTAYQLPTFTVNVLDNDVVFTLNVKNVSPESIETRPESSGIHVKFSSVGSGYSPTNYAFYLRFAAEATAILSHSAEAWDNNVVLQLELSSVPTEFFFGKDRCQPLNRSILRSGTEKTETETHLHSNCGQVRVEGGENEEKEALEHRLEAEEDVADVEEEEVFHTATKGEDIGEPPATTKLTKKDKQQKQKENKKKRKGRSLSESDVVAHQKEASVGGSTPEQGKSSGAISCPDNKQREEVGTPATGVAVNRKVRSVSESGGDILDANGNLFHFKGILKRRSVSESCSSLDDQAVAGMSMDHGVYSSFGGIPEDEEYDSDHLMGSSEKKHVTFNDVIRKQLFRADSSIVGRKLKNLKKRAAKKRADARRLSESENSEGEDRHREDEEDNAEETQPENARRDSGIDFSDDGTSGVTSHEDGGVKKTKKKRKGKGGNSGSVGASDLEFKSGMIFNMEM